MNTDVSMNNRLFVGGDVSFGGRLFLGPNTIPASAIIGGVGTGGNTTANSFSGRDLSLNGKLVVLGDASFGGRILVPPNSIPITAIQNFNNTTTTATVNFTNDQSNGVANGVIINTLDLSLNGNLYANGSGTSIFRSDTVFRKRVFVYSDLTINGNLYANFAPNSIPPSAIIGGVGGGGGALSNQYVDAQLIQAGNLIVNNNTSLSGNLAIGLPTAATTLHVVGGTILSGGGFPKKIYSYSCPKVTVNDNNTAAFVMTFNNTSAYYANVTAMLVDQTNASNISVLIFDLTGGDASGNATNNLVVDTIARKGANTTSGWSTNYSTTTNTMTLFTTNQTSNNYSASFYIEMFCGPYNNDASLASIKPNNITAYTFNY